MADLQALFTNNTRTDDYVNATNWCKAFGKQLSEFKRLPSTKDFLKALERKLSDDQGLSRVVISKEKSGRVTETWVHPLLAIKLAEWLSPDFEVFVKDIFRRYLQADETLAKEIMARSQGKEARKAFTTELQKRGAKRFTFAAATNAIYQPLFGMDAAELKEELNTTVTRDPMRRSELAALMLAECMAMDNMEDTDAQGHKALVECAADAGKRVARAFD